MSQQRNDSLRQLHALERWRQTQLAAARARYTELAAQLEQQRALLEYCKQQCLGTQELLRSQLRSAQPLSPSALLRLSDFAAIQAQEQQRQQARLQSAQVAAEAAHRVVKESFEQVSVVQKLMERRRQLLRAAQQQRQQRTLDEQAAGRRAPHGGTTQP